MILAFGEILRNFPGTGDRKPTNYESSESVDIPPYLVFTRRAYYVGDVPENHVCSCVRVRTISGPRKWRY